MTNPLKGEVTFEARGQTFTYKLGTNAQIMIENKTGLSIQEFFAQRSETFTASDVRTIFHAGLFRQHKMSEEDVGDLIDELGPDRVGKIFIEAVTAAFPPQKSNGAANESRPTKPTKESIGTKN